MTAYAGSHGAPRVRLEPIEADDLALYEAVHCDPVMMEHLGGPLPKEGLADKLRRDAAATAADEVWVYKIVVDEGDAAAGTVCIWEHSEHGTMIAEIGWMVLPAFQGRGVGGAAARALLDKARAEGRWGVVHAFPPVDNPASNAMCRKLGFTWVETCDFEFRDRPLRGNHWQLDLGAAPVER